MKHPILFLIFFLLYGQVCLGVNRQELLEKLDKAVSNRQFYMDRKERKIDSLRNLLHPALSLDTRYNIQKEIFGEYSTYRSDSAMRYVYLNKEIALSLANPVYTDETTLQQSLLLSTIGLYLESIGNLKKIDRHKLDTSLLYDYYSVTEWTYYAAGEYTNDSLYAPQYRKIQKKYIDSLLTVIPPDTPYYTYYHTTSQINKGKMEDALHIFLELYQKLPVNTRLYAIVTFDIANIYKVFGNMDKYEEFLILAAISDQECPLKENLAMQELALYLFSNKPDDLDRAWNYIQCSMEDARFYNNRLRIVQISQKLPVIVQAYQQKIEKEKSDLKMSLMVISLLSFLTLFLLFYLLKQIHQKKIKQQQLHQLNTQLNRLNSRLNESNSTKEEYVGLFMDLCSSYIEKLDKYRETVKRKVMARQIDDLYKMTNSTRAIDEELGNFLHNFDMAFLSLYPTFVDEINKLLSEEGKLTVKKGELLNTELRIFALIRLGIKDSSKIAAFLRYSPQTIYNYRTRVKNKAIIEREEFEKRIMEIGKPENV